MKLTKSKLKQIIKEEIQRVLRESRIESIEAASIEDAESLMDPMYRAHSEFPQSSFIEEDTQFFIVTLVNGDKINAQLRDGKIDLYDLQDREINDEALAQEILKGLRDNETNQIKT
tara:strand:+ start:258 stop:605 length:348 start_codon:yes stop_codon:yes gene_type:complete